MDVTWLTTNYNVRQSTKLEHINFYSVQWYVLNQANGRNHHNIMDVAYSKLLTVFTEVQIRNTLFTLYSGTF